MTALMLAGCLKEGPRAPETVRVPYEEHAPEWYLSPPEADADHFYATGEGNTTAEAEARALASFRRRFAERVVAETARKRAAGQGVYAYLSESGVRRVGQLLAETTYPATLRKGERLSVDKTVVLMAIDRKKAAAPLKKETMRRLVAVEEQWLKARDSNILARYRLARTSLGKMQALLPWYLAADAIPPFSDNVAGRVEQGTPYFARTAKRLRKRLRFCLEPVRVPALKLFAHAVEEGLAHRHLATRPPAKASKEVLCITVGGELLHKRLEGRHVVDADITLTIHEKYGAPVTVERYRVKGVSAESGPDALQKAAEALEKEVEKRFLFNG
jgi:hypothetical protein